MNCRCCDIQKQVIINNQKKVLEKQKHDNTWRTIQGQYSYRVSLNTSFLCLSSLSVTTTFQPQII